MTDDPQLTSDERIELNLTANCPPRKLEFWHNYGDTPVPHPQTRVGDALHFDVPIIETDRVDNFTLVSLSDAHRLWLAAQVYAPIAPLGQPVGRYYTEDSKYRRDFDGGYVRKSTQDE